MSKSWTYMFDDKDNTIDNFLFLTSSSNKLISLKEKESIYVLKSEVKLALV